MKMASKAVTIVRVHWLSHVVKFPPPPPPFPFSLKRTALSECPDYRPLILCRDVLNNKHQTSIYL